MGVMYKTFREMVTSPKGRRLGWVGETNSKIQGK